MMNAVFFSFEEKDQDEKPASYELKLYKYLIILWNVTWESNICIIYLSVSETEPL